MAAGEQTSGWFHGRDGGRRQQLERVMSLVAMGVVSFDNGKWYKLTSA